MRLISWNILHGGGDRRDAICSAIAAHDPDVIVLSEVRADSISEIRSSLWMAPWKHCAFTSSESKENALCVLSRELIIVRNSSSVPDENTVRWLDVDLPTYGFGLGALHIPTALGRLEPDGGSKSRFWAALLCAATDRLRQPFLFVGDLNTGRRGIDEPGRTFICWEEFERMTELGWTDAWRHYHGSEFEPSWVSNKGDGYRLDHAFVSPALLSRLALCRYSHTERQCRLSDHSILLLDIDPHEPGGVVTEG